ncbi:MAG: ABC transporter permease [Ktedonobacteraceae bacterium]
MSTVATTTESITKASRLHIYKPSFIGLVRGELFKINRQLTTWIMLILFMGAIFLPYLIMFVESDIKDVITAPGDGYVYGRVAAGLALLRIFGGFVVMILTARVIGQEYQLGTIRIVLARGIGRVQLLLAKLTAIGVWVIYLMVIGLALNALLAITQVSIVTGNLNALTSLSSTVWYNLGIYILTILVSLALTILMATAITVLFRSFAGGLSASIAWFPADNIIGVILIIAFALTQNDFWRNISAYLLGPNLNVMAGRVANIQSRAWVFGEAPLVTVDGNHTLLIALGYAVIFMLAAIVLTWKRDVKE